MTTVITTPIQEATTAYYTFTLVDDEGDGLDVSLLTTMTLTAYDIDTLAIINMRTAQNVQNANDVTIITDPGPPVVTTVVWELRPADTVILHPQRRQEDHAALFRWTWDNGARAGAHEMRYTVENLSLVPAP